MAVLVTGASGFLGSRLVERLAAEGRDVVAVARRSVPPIYESNPRIQWCVRDIARDGFDPSGLPEIEVVIHLAGATLGAGWDEAGFLQANEQTTVRLLQAMAGRSNRFVFASSQVVYGDACCISVTEDFPLRPDGSAYACSKLNSENWLRWFQKRHGGQYLALRFCGFIDGGGIVDYLIDKALSGEPIELYSRGAVRRDYLPSSDGIDVLISALNYCGTSGFLPVNIGSGQVVSAYELATAIRTELQSPSHIALRENPAPQGDLVFSIELARQLFGFQPGNLINEVRHYARQRQIQNPEWVGNEKN